MDKPEYEWLAGRPVSSAIENLIIVLLKIFENLKSMKPYDRALRGFHCWVDPFFKN